MESIASKGQRILILHLANSALLGLLEGRRNHNHYKNKQCQAISIQEEKISGKTFDTITILPCLLATVCNSADEVITQWQLQLHQPISYNYFMIGKQDTISNRVINLKFMPEE